MIKKLKLKKGKGLKSAPVPPSPTNSFVISKIEDRPGQGRWVYCHENGGPLQIVSFNRFCGFLGISMLTKNLTVTHIPSSQLMGANKP